MIDKQFLFWTIGLIVGFPLLAIILGEQIYRLQRQGNPFTETLRIVRNWVLPLLVFALFAQQVLQLPTDAESSYREVVKTLQTLFWLSVIQAILSLLNTLLFERAKAGTWRARMPKLLIDLFRVIVVLLGGAIVLATVWQADLAGLATALGVSSIVVGLALQDTLGSIMSGIALLFERPFVVGDWLRVGDLAGQVIDINWRSVRLQTFDREMVVIPHKLVSSEILRNFSQPLRIHAERIRIGFSYNDPPNLAKQVLHTTALETQGIVSYPEPQIFTASYDDFAITYEVKFFIEDYGNLEAIRDRFLSRVWYAAQRNNLKIPFPTRTHYHFDGPTTLADDLSTKLTESWEALPAFVPLERPEATDREIALQHFGSGETVVRQGALNNALYIVISGRAVMTVKHEKTMQEKEVLPLQAGEFFGEMSLFSGKPSPISIVAVDDLEVMQLSATVVDRTIERQPNFAREISQILENRRRALQKVQQAIDEGRLA
jgi:small-conductance mechanosensitive channel